MSPSTPVAPPYSLAEVQCAATLGKNTLQRLNTRRVLTGPVLRLLRLTGRARRRRPQ
jgi:hypothetical protein